MCGYAIVVYPLLNSCAPDLATALTTKSPAVDGKDTVNCNDAFSPRCVKLTGREAGDELEPAGSTSVTSAFAAAVFWVLNVTTKSFCRGPFNGTTAMTWETKNAN